MEPFQFQKKTNTYEIKSGVFQEVQIRDGEPIVIFQFKKEIRKRKRKTFVTRSFCTGKCFQIQSRMYYYYFFKLLIPSSRDV